MRKIKCFEKKMPRFYGRRIGHPLSKRKQNLINDLLPTLVIDLGGSEVFYPSQVFQPGVEIWMEIGFGAGEHLAHQAIRRPDIGFIGCDPYVNGVASLLDHIERNSLRNIRIYNDDARILIKKLAPMQLSQVFLFFSDPWPKNRHNSRRFTAIENLNALSRVMKNGAELKFASDDNNFVRWSLYQFYRHQDFKWIDEERQNWLTPFDPSITTRYETKAVKAGRQCVYFRFQKHERNQDAQN